MLQEEQLPDEQEEQAEPPTGELKPSAPLLKDENTESIRSAPSWPLGQVAGSSARLIGRRSSNLASQRRQEYSYRGICHLSPPIMLE